MICIDQRKRLSIDDIMDHIWIKSYFDDHNDTELMHHEIKKYNQIKPRIAESNTFQYENDDYCAAIDE